MKNTDKEQVMDESGVWNCPLLRCAKQSELDRTRERLEVGSGWRRGPEELQRGVGRQKPRAPHRTPEKWQLTPLTECSEVSPPKASRAFSFVLCCLERGKPNSSRS